MDAHRIVVIGASEGGVSALRALIGALPEDLPAAVFVVLHIGAHDSDLPAILSRSGQLPVVQPKDGDPIRPGCVYVAAPDHHMIVADGAIRLTKGPRENFARPSIDPLFRSVAEEYGPAAIGVILTGGLNDGTAGLYEIKRRGGVTIVQDPDDATNPSMPRSALHHVAVDHCAPLAMIPRLIARAAAERGAAMPLSPLTSSESLPSEGLKSAGLKHEELASAGLKSEGLKREGVESDMTAEFTLNHPVAVTCPDCGGAVRQSRLGSLTQFRCHIGHVYTAEVMLDGQFRAMEQSIEAAMRSLNERAELCRQMAEQAGPAHASSAQWRLAMDEARDQTEPLRGVLERNWMRPPMPATRA